MFDNLTARLKHSFKNIRGQGRLNEHNIKESLREVKKAFIEADVAYPVVKAIIEQVRQGAIGQKVTESLAPGQAFIKIVNDTLTTIMGSHLSELNLSAQTPIVMMIAGLQGSGKTTTVAKLAAWLKTQKNKSVLLTSTDIHRPAAILQLENLAENSNVLFHPSCASQTPTFIVQTAIQTARNKGVDVVIIDTAGRLHIDDRMMEELRTIHTVGNPIETLFVLDSMMGQDAVKVAQGFNDVIPLSGIILSKMDADARGGAALSVKFMLGKPIKFIGSGEKVTALEPFYPDRIASRILGMGDILSLVEEVQRHTDQKSIQKLNQKLQKGKKFDLQDFLNQLKQMDNIGGMEKLLNKLPEGNNMALLANAKNTLNKKQMSQMQAIICAMTQKERQFPDLIQGSRKRRIASGSGTQIQDVNRLLKQFNQMQKMMKRFSKPGSMTKLLQGLQNHYPR
ncbi:signal recognition particle protein [Rickettsiella grylli]|uniref:Signal recognition particle protein n=1 Tax=Rickettsiella grylli TaxID=59196 RepID=A8PP08_9COXI|nr:signal recognition particle protein [Rickettsiella grylli]EDP46208.1 signal recognition particle protein [Rickettsiella grylli]